MLKFIFSFSFLALFFAFGQLMAQDLNEPYVVTGLSADGTRAITFTVRYEMGLDAVITRTERAATAEDKGGFFYLLKHNNVEFDSNPSGIGMNLLVTTSDPKDYFFINFDDSKPKKYGGKIGAVLKPWIICDCVGSKEKEDCIMNNITKDEDGHVICVSNERCPSCAMSVTDPKGKAQKGSAIMIRAKSVKFVK